MMYPPSKEYRETISLLQTNKIRTVGLVLGMRPGGWANFEPALSTRIAFAGLRLQI